METAEADIETAEELSKVSHSNTNLHGTNEGPIRSANRAGHGEKELVQALGLSFTVSTVALAINVTCEGGLRLAIASDTLVALVPAVTGR